VLDISQQLLSSRQLSWQKTDATADPLAVAVFGCNYINLWAYNTAPVTACARSNKCARLVICYVILCPHYHHVIKTKTSGYATWFTAGGAIRIAHYDVIDDVITRKL